MYTVDSQSPLGFGDFCWQCGRCGTSSHPQVQLLPQLNHLSSVQAAELLVLVVEVLLKGWVINLETTVGEK